MAEAKHFPPVEHLRECFDYDPLTGLFVWRARPEKHFANAGAWVTWNKRFAGKPAFKEAARNGYLLGRVSFGGAYFKMLAHRVAWALMTGAHPKEQVDHKDRQRANNRWANLREASQTQNNWHSADRDRSLPRGVDRNGKNGFSARLCADGDCVHLGTFRTPEEASRVWQNAASKTRSTFLEGAA